MAISDNFVAGCDEVLLWESGTKDYSLTLVLETPPCQHYVLPDVKSREALQAVK